MAIDRFSVSKQALIACALASSALGAGCSSVERTPIEQLMAVQTVMPIAKPGTELTAYALPAPVNAPASTVAALAAETAMMTPAANAATAQIASNEPAAAPAGVITPQPLALAATTPGTATPDALVVATLASTKTDRSPQIPQGMVAMATMDSDFDTGEPVGLETLVATRMIVPMPKPALIAAAYAKAEEAVTSLIPDALIITERPASGHADIDKLITFYARLNGLPEELVHRVVKRESTYNPRAYNKGNYGLMQIRYNTAKGLGYQGPAEGLFDAETNLKYATQYLRGAWMVADNQNDNAVRLYASGYYYHAKKKGLLETLGMK